MATKNNYQSITLYKDMAPQILELEKEEAGEIFQAIMKYSSCGEDTDMSKYDRFVRSLWQTIKLKLKAGEEHDKQISAVRAEAGKKGGQAKAINSQDLQTIQAKAINSTTITDTITGTISSTLTNSSTVTDAEEISLVSDSVTLSASAVASAEPPACDLFSLKQLIFIANKNKVNLTEDGVQAFHEDMQESGWVLYKKPVEKKNIIKVLRGYAKFHSEYGQTVEMDSENESEDSGQDAMERSIYKISSNYISRQLFNENIGGHHCLINDYCPKEAFTDEQLSYMQEVWSVWPKLEKYILKKDPNLQISNEGN